MTKNVKMWQNKENHMYRNLNISSSYRISDTIAVLLFCA